MTMKVSIELPDGLKVVAHPPKLVSKRNCLEVLGLKAGDFKAALARARAEGVPVLVLAKLHCVELEVFLEWARTQRARALRPANDGASDASPSPALPASPAGPKLTEAHLDQRHSMANVAPKGRR